MAQKKKLLDEELKKMTFVGKGADGKVTGNFKFVPVSRCVACVPCATPALCTIISASFRTGAWMQSYPSSPHKYAFCLSEFAAVIGL
jgi:hypothetical protein